MEVGKEKAALKPEIVFVILATSFGLLFLIINPPFQVADEYQHFHYAYAVSIGKLHGFTSVIPRSVQALADVTNPLPFHADAIISYGDLTKFIYVPLKPSDTVPAAYQSVSKYNPFSYIPVAIGLRIATLLNLNPLALFYFGRITNLCLWIIISYHALKFLPDYKWTFLLLFLMPMSLYQAGSYSADVILNALSFLWIGMCLNYSSVKEQELSLMSSYLIILVAALLALTKPPYIFLLGLFFLIPQANYGSRGQYKKTIGLLFFTSFILFLFSLVYLKNDMSITTASDKSLSLIDQLAFISKSPLRFPSIVLQSIYYYWKYYYMSTVGILGYLDTNLPIYIYVTYPIAVFFMALFDNQKQIVFSLKQRFISLFVAAAVFFALILSLYLTWTPVGYSKIEGFQGRYVIPVLPILIPLFKNRLFVATQSWKCILVTLYLIITLSVTVGTLLFRYYAI